MKWVIWNALIMSTFSGCIPIVQYEALYQKLGIEIAKRRDLEKKLDACEDQEAKLKEEIKNRPAAKIEPAKLEEIKRQAREETERKFKGADQKQ